MAEKVLTQVDNGTTVDVHGGDRVVIRLPENPTTGYRWAAETVDDRIVSPVSSEFAPPAGSGVGAGGAASFAFEARAPGEGSIRLKRWRDWEGESSVRERYTIKLVVHPGSAR